MKTLINLMLVVVVLALVAGVIFVVMSLGSDEDVEKSPTRPTVKPITYMSTSGVVDNIERRLEPKAGRALDVRCPKKVDEAVGTKFRCSIRYAGVKKRIAVAKVKISGPQGEFTWVSGSA